MAFFNSKHVFLLFFTCTVLLMACKKVAVDPDKIEPLPEKFTYTANVYTTGYSTDSVTGVRQAIYWKNDEPHLLTNGTREASGNAIAVKGSDVYVSGYFRESSTKFVAYYWKNGVINRLDESSANSSAGDIFISGNDIYITGFVGSDAVYWKNGIRITLSRLPYNTIASTSGIGVIGSDIYVSGYQLGAQSGAALWKNGLPEILPGGGSYGGSIAVQNNDIYIAASYGQPSKSNTVTNYWKNGVPVVLSNKTYAINIIDLAVEGLNVYVASNSEIGPVYYKNDNLIIVDSKTQYPYISSLAVLNNDVYVAGYASFEKKSVATFWRNGQMVRLFSPIGKSGSISDIAVTPLQ